MRIVKVRKTKLLKKLKENMSKHVELAEKAELGYKKAIRVALEGMLSEISNGRIPRFSNLTSLQEPVNNEEEYERAIAMLEMSVDDIIELSEQEFSNFVLDDWSWKQHSVLTNTRYMNFLENN